MAETITVETDRDGIHRITGAVEDAVAAAGVGEGAVTVFARHTTAAVVINEDDPALHDDIRDVLYDLVPHDSDADYRHGTHEHQPNAHAHLKALLLGPEKTIPIEDGAPVLGTSQEVFLVDPDGPREREVAIQVHG